MVGQGVLRECLLDPQVEAVQTIGRSATGEQNPKLREMVRPDLMRYREVEAELGGYDACFFCLGVSSAGMSEAEYERCRKLGPVTLDDTPPSNVASAAPTSEVP